MYNLLYKLTGVHTHTYMKFNLHGNTVSSLISHLSRSKIHYSTGHMQIVPNSSPCIYLYLIFDSIIGGTIGKFLWA